MATGFQVVVQSHDLDLAHELYIGQTSELEWSNPVTVEVKMSGLYQISVIPILQGTGIADSNVEYREIVALNNMSTTSSGML